MPNETPDLKRLAAGTGRVYERNAAAFDAQRARRLFERPWLERFVEPLPAGATILDVGCGSGDPFTTWFMERGFRVTGVDVADNMLAIARQRFPDGDWRHADMRTLDLGKRFDGVISWHAFFHLTPDEQRQAMPRLVAHLKPGGALMVTVGPDAGETVGHVNGERVYHASLAPSEYETLLQGLGMRLVAFVKEDPACDMSTVLLAAKSAR